MHTLKNIFLIAVFLLAGVLNSMAAKVDSVSIYSAAMNKSVKCVVITPESYHTQKEKRFPVVYLLHGYSGNYSNWITKVPDIKHDVDEFNLIIVCPDGAYSSWYFDSPVEENSRYKTYVGVEVPAYIDSAFKTIPERSARAISGLSMGGHGAIFLSWSFPETFGAAGSMSGAVDLVSLKSKYGFEKILGDTTNMDLFYKNSVVNVVKSHIDNYPALIIDCGTKDPFINDNRLLHSNLMNLEIPHDYTERPGGHNWEYWQNSVPYQLLFFHQFFEKK